MTSGLVPRAASALVLLLSPLCAGCTSHAGPAGPAAASTATVPAADVPASATALEALVVTDVPSGLPRVPDDELDPPAGEKTIDDVARYGQDAKEQRAVLQDYGYLRGWERFWRSGTALTSVFLDQFQGSEGASSYAEDLARNDADYYGGSLDHSPGDLPAGCVLMVRDFPTPERGISGPAAFAWCPSGVFTVSVAAVATSSGAARAELMAVTRAPPPRRPPG